ncbi:MAG: hypothetical protein ACJZ9G_06650 [Rhodospirillales bacterium]
MSLFNPVARKTVGANIRAVCLSRASPLLGQRIQQGFIDAMFEQTKMCCCN